MHLPDLHDTIVAVSTAPGIGAIGMIRVSGMHSIQVVNEVFSGCDLEKTEGYTVHFGRIHDHQLILDEVIAIVYRNPKSYTGEDMVELTCHGSPFILQKITALLTRQEARIATPGEFTLRAFLNGKMDLSQAEAVADLINAGSEKAHQVAMQQMRGGYSGSIKLLRQELIDFAALIELELDFSEEDVEFAQRNDLLLTVQKLQKLIYSLIRSFELGNAIKNGVPTVIAGKPNAGKSTLLNALLNEDRAIVSEIPGTTRDTIEEVLNIDGLLFRLIDTAGLREAKDSIEAMGVKKSLEKMKKSSLLIYIFDLQNTNPKMLEKELKQLPGNTKLIAVGNKLDLLDRKKTAKLFENQKSILLSGKTGEGLDALRKEMTTSILSGFAGSDHAIVSSLRHAEALQKAYDTLQAVKTGLANKAGGELLALDLRIALDALGSITGEVSSDDLLGAIFSRFCIGK